MLQDNLFLLASGWLGLLIHSLQKADSLKKDAAVANIDFDLARDYLRRDMLGLIAAALIPLAWMIFRKEIELGWDFAAKFPKLAIFFVGAVGSYGAQMAFGSARKLIRKAVDIKTNIADENTDNPMTTLSQVKKQTTEGTN